VLEKFEVFMLILVVLVARVGWNVMMGWPRRTTACPDSNAPTAISETRQAVHHTRYEQGIVCDILSNLC
jgi:hypothetical protein